MLIDINRRSFLKAFFFDAADQYLKDVGDAQRFSWDDFWKNLIQFCYMKKTTDELSSIALDSSISHEERVAAIDSMQYPILDSDLDALIQELKIEYYQEREIRYTSLEERMPEIIHFFKTYRDIDLEPLSDDERYKVLNSDHCDFHEEHIYKAMGLSILEYRYLYQRGGYHK